MNSNNQLVVALAEQLKVPLLQILRLAEHQGHDSIDEIKVVSSQTLRLLESYLESTSQEQLPLEPVVPGSILYDAAAVLQPLACQRGYRIAMNIAGRDKPVMANRRSLKNILALTAACIIEAAVESDDDQKLIVLASHLSKRGSVVGVFTGSSEDYENVSGLMKLAQSPGASGSSVFGSAGSAALAVAGLLSERMGTSLKIYSHQTLKGVGNLLMPSHQLKLV